MSEPPYRVAWACERLGALAGTRLHFLVRDVPMRGGHLDVEDQTIRTQLAAAARRAAAGRLP